MSSIMDDLSGFADLYPDITLNLHFTNTIAVLS
jgi:hypothetical protein